VHTPGLRYETRLLRAVPPGAAAFISAPNYGESLAEAYALFEQRVQQSAVLREWWEKEAPRGRGPSLAEIVERLRRLGQHVGDEVAIALVPGAGPTLHHLLLAEPGQAGLRDFIETALFADLPKHPRIQFAEGAMAAAPAAAADLYVLIRPDIVAASDDWATLRATAACLDGPGGGLDRTPFGQRIVDAYREGTSLLVAADASRARHGAGALGTGELRYFVAKHAEVGGRSRNTADLVFVGARKGIASWLGVPAPMGSLDFISPEALGALSFVTKNPALVFEDVLDLQHDRSKAEQSLAEAETHLGIRVREDLMAALGSDFTVALDGPLLPTPAFKLVAEVNDSLRLEQTLETLVDKYNIDAARDGRPALRLEHDQVGGRTFHVLRGDAPPVKTEVHYAFVDGYVVAAPSRALVMQAIAVRETGRSLSRSSHLTDMLAADGETHVSALLYQNLGAATPLAQGLGSLSAEQQRLVQALAVRARPSLIYAYGREDRIQLAGDMFSLDPTSLALPVLMKRATGGALIGVRR
jgi:hypothetical protein